MAPTHALQPAPIINPRSADNKKPRLSPGHLEDNKEECWSGCVRSEVLKKRWNPGLVVCEEPGEGD
jgi:hypothetical protein